MLNSVLNYLERSVENYPDKSAIVDANGSITYKELCILSKKIATKILEVSSMKKSPISVIMNKSAKTIACFMAIVYTNNFYVPLDKDMPKKRIEKIFDSLSEKLVITDKENYELVLDMVNSNTKVIVIDEDISKIEINGDEIKRRSEKVLDVDPLYVIFTSGSTGDPKGVIISHKSVIDFAEESSEAMNFSKDEVFVNQAPFHFDASVPDIYCTIRNAATLHLVKKELYEFPFKILDYINANNINAVFWVPSVLIMMANTRLLDRKHISCLQKIMFCGEVMPVKQLNIWRNSLPNANYVNYYGPSETTYACTYYKVNREFESTERLPIGKPCRNTEIIIIDENNNEVKEPRVVGELYVKGTCLFLGYYNNSEKTNEELVKNPLVKEYPDYIYKTGDLVQYNDYGELEYISRKDYQIKLNGYRIELGEIENAISGISAIEMNYCLFDEVNNIIVAVYSLAKDSEITEGEIKEILQKALPTYMIPKKYIYVKKMLMNSNGKIDRKLIKQNYMNNNLQEMM